MDKCFNKSICNILKTAEKEMLNLRHPYVGTEHLLLSLLQLNKVKNICYKYKLTYDNFKKELLSIIGSATKKSEVILYTPLLNQVIDHAYNRALEEHNEFDEMYLLKSLFNESDGIALRIAQNMNVDTESLIKEINEPVLIGELGINLNETVKEEIFLRDKEIAEIMQILLRKNKNNPLLIGPSGVGKTAIIEELAFKIKNKMVPIKLQKYEIILINTSTLIAGTKYRGEFEERINNLIKEVKNAKNIILFIDEIHTLVKTGASDGSIDAGNILKPYLARGDIKVIGATTINEYNEYLKKDTALIRRFAPIMINEPSLKDMEYIINKVKTNYEKYYDLKIPVKTTNYLIKNCNKYFPNLYNPDKSIDILDTACSKKVLTNNNTNTTILPEDIYDVICSRINLLSVSDEEIDKIGLKLKNRYNDQIIKNIINIIKSKDQNKYMYLNGGDYKNKLNIIKYISKTLHIKLINIDCIEYNDEYSINKLINNNYLYNEINDNPCSFIIFNNYEEANKILYNIIKVMINKGYITNNNNEIVKLNNTIIFLLNNSNNTGIGFNNQNNLLINS